VELDQLGDIRIIDRTRVRALLPSLPEQIKIAGDIYRDLAKGNIEMPPKIGIHPRENSFIHAMPAFLQYQDVATVKLVSGYPANPSKGIPYIHGVIVVFQAETGKPVALLDGAEITAARTAAASGACVEALAPVGWSRVAVLGCGEQASYHARVLHALNSDVEILAYDPVRSRAETLHPNAQACSTPREAVEAADVVITAGPIVSDATPVLTVDWLKPECLVLPIDFDFYVTSELVADSKSFAVDDVAQYDYYRSLGFFQNWAEGKVSTGELLGSERASGVTTVANLGVGALDAGFAAAVLAADDSTSDRWHDLDQRA